jgi:hypothetical protein
MSSSKPLVYLILGPVGSGRREVLADLIEGGLGEGDRAAVLLAESEPADAADARLPNVGRWQGSDVFLTADLPADATHVFLVTDGRRNPVEQLEACRSWLESNGAELARIFTVVHCRLIEQQPPLTAWFDACLHFSDVALLNRRDGVANKWLSDFVARCEKQFHPCIFELVKAGRVKNPALVLDPQARRVSHAFDAEQDWLITDGEGEEIDDQEEVDDEEEVEINVVEDIYFERDATGRHAKRIPELTKYLDQPPAAAG